MLAPPLRPRHAVQGSHAPSSYLIDLVRVLGCEMLVRSYLVRDLEAMDPCLSHGVAALAIERESGSADLASLERATGVDLSQGSRKPLEG